MHEFVTLHEAALRLGSFCAVALAMAGWEALAPRRPLSLGRARRWPVNLGMVALATLLVRLLFPAAVLAATATWAQDQGMGLFNTTVLPGAPALVLSILALDLLVYGQHVAFHRMPVLWRLHRVHHADLDIDFTTGVRFHPVEIILSLLIKMAAVTALGAPVAAVVLFEMLLNATAMFNHGNVRLAPALDSAIRVVLVTPDMHRVHHSVIARETNSNFGFCLSLWDRIFATYRAQPEAGHDAMTIGLPFFRDEADQGLWKLLANPIVEGAGENDTKMP